LNPPWGTARALGADVVRRLLDMGWSKDACLNVNFPPLPPDQAGPLTLARQGVGMIAGMHVETRTDPRGITYYWLNFRRGNRVQGPESDYDALRAGKIVVTPLRYDRTDEDAYRTLAQDLPRFNGPRSER
jgi:5'-nucleotidase